LVTAGSCALSPPLVKTGGFYQTDPLTGSYSDKRTHCIFKRLEGRAAATITATRHAADFGGCDRRAADASNPLLEGSC
jgi:hypothetical protein